MDNQDIINQEHVLLPPYPSVLVESLRNIGYTMETAVADIIDNSITAEASSISVRFDWNNAIPWIAIIDNGYGMSKDVMLQAMRFGSRSPNTHRDTNDLGRFGLGMKTASISQCRNMTVCSKRDDSLSACEWDLDQLNDINSSDWKLRVFSISDITSDDILSFLVSNHLSDVSSGTIVLWRKIDNIIDKKNVHLNENKFNEAMYHTRKHLEVVFHRFISADNFGRSIKIDFNNNVLSAFNPFGPNIPSRQELPQEVLNIDGGKIVIQPYVLPHYSKTSSHEYKLYAGEEGYLQNQGFYVYRNKRLIVKATWFRLIKKEELNKLIRVRIDIPNHLDHLWSVNINKSQVVPPEIVKKQLKKIIQKISGRGKRVFTRRATVLSNKMMTPLWNREVADGKVSYAINFQHPVVESVFSGLDEKAKTKIISCLNMIVTLFPYDVYYADAASDDLQVVKELDISHVRELYKELITSLKDSLLDSAAAKEALAKIEIPSRELIDIEQLIQEVYDNAIH